MSQTTRTNGYVVLKKSILEWRYIEDAEAFRLFLYLLVKAAFGNTEVHYMRNVRGGKCLKCHKLKRGQVFTNAKTIANDLGYGEDTKQVYATLKKLADDSVGEKEIECKKVDGGEIITIINYDKHQTVDKREPDEKKQNKSKRSESKKKQETENHEEEPFKLKNF